MQPQKLAEFEKLFSDYATHEEVGSAIKDLVDAVKQVKLELSKDISANKSTTSTLASDIARIEKGLTSLIADSVSLSNKELKSLLTQELSRLSALIPQMPEAFDPTDLQNQIDVLMAYEAPELKAVTVRDLLETLSGEERLDASAIKNLPQFLQDKMRQTGFNIALSSLLDVNLAGITAGQSIQWDGVQFVPFTPAGGGGTPVWAEDLTSQGPGTVYTLAHTPIAGTVRVFKGGAYQQAGASGDYTISGATITFNVSTQSGEVIVCDYSYT